MDGSNRQPKFILPSVADRLRAGLPIDGLALVGALWCRYCHGETESGAPIEPNDPEWARLQQRARAARRDPAAWLGMRDLFGELGADARYREAFGRALQRVWANGTRATLSAYLAGAA